MTSYENTPHTLCLPPAAARKQEKEEQNSVECHDLFGDGSALLLDGVLTPHECTHLIEQGTTLGFQSCGYDESIRVTDRLVAKSDELATMLFGRIRPFLEDTIDLCSRVHTPKGICPWFQKGHVWKPIGLNETFRLCRYRAGGFFKPHHDGGFDRSATERSIKTVMIYLNSSFEGGPTNFYNETQRHYVIGDPKKVTRSVQPRTGSALIFNSAITHDGGTVVDGEKYILRSEVMYSPLGWPTSEEGEGSKPNKPDHEDVDLDNFKPDGY